MERTDSDARKVACLTAAGFLGVVIFGVTAAPAYSRGPEVIVKGQRIDPVAQRRVPYDDLNLALRPQQKILNARIRTAADDLCGPALGYNSREIEQALCVGNAVIGTRSQVRRVIERAERQLAGFAVGPAVAISIVANGR